MFQKKCFFPLCIVSLVLLIVKSSTQLSLTQIDNAGSELTDPKAALDYYCN